MSKRHLSERSAVAEVLLEFVGSAGDIVKAMEYPSLAMRMGATIARDYMDEKQRSRKRQAYYRLRRRGLLKQVSTAEGLRYALTENGAVEYLRQLILAAPMMDGDEVCMVVFDIPEKYRTLRRELCRFLEAASFLAYQKSVFISPFDAFDSLSKLFALKGANAWVKVYRATLVTDMGRSATK